MKVGMLWLMPANDKPLAEKISAAAEHYARKYGRAPSLCYCNYGDIKGAPESLIDPAKGLSITIRGSSVILPRHLWIGMEDQS